MKFTLTFDLTPEQTEQLATYVNGHRSGNHSRIFPADESIAIAILEQIATRSALEHGHQAGPEAQRCLEQAYKTFRKNHRAAKNANVTHRH